MVEIPERVINTIWQRVDVQAPSDCWLWKLSVGSHGYGQVGWGLPDGRNAGTTAHRVAWIAANGPIPDGLTIDHLCRNRRCCNPSHLRLLTLSDNASDNGMKRRTHCVHGHEYDEANTYRNPRTGHRSCRRCARIARGYEAA